MKCLLVWAFGLVTMTCFSDCLAQEIPVKGYRLVWSDEFNGSVLDKAKWGLRSPGKRGDAFNDYSAVRLDGKGNLIIEATNRNGKVYSGMIDTERRFEFTYGYLECRVKTCSTPGLWCAAWLQSSKNRANGMPGADGLEIDVFEYMPHIYRDSISHSLHWGGYGATHQVFGPFYSRLTNTGDGFHTVGLLWTENEYRIYVDGVETQRTGLHISHVPEFVILSLEASRQVAGPLNTGRLPDMFVVDYIRVYQQ